MKKPEEKKGNIVRHIQSARQWLEHAEHAVKSERSARGDLDLILARAEVQLAQEKRSSEAEMPSRIMAFAFRPQNMLFIALGGIAVSVLLIFNMWHNSAQGVNMYAAYSGKGKASAEFSAPKDVNAPTASALPVAEKQGIEAVPGEAKNDSTENHAPLLLPSKNDAAAAQPVIEPATTVAHAQPTSVSEQEIRVLMRTAERVLKDTK